MTSSRAALALFALSLHAASASKLQLFEAVEPHMGTLMRIKLYAENTKTAQVAFRAAFDRIAAIDRALTDYQPDSELNRLSRTATIREQRVSDDLFSVLCRSQALAKETNGAFDVTVGPLTHLWREARKAKRIPSEDAIQEARSHVGVRKLHVNAASRTVRLDQSGMQLDVGGIAKGYAADQGLLVLKQHGVRSALVAASGDLAFSAAPPEERGWKIGVEGGNTLVLANAAVSTSGDAEQHLDAGGLRYSHVIGTRAGFGLTNRMSVTVVAPRGIDADGAGTAVDVLGVDAGLRFIERHRDLAALLMLRDRTPPRMILSKRFRNF